jgi:hypothetical protein
LVLPDGGRQLVSPAAIVKESAAKVPVAMTFYDHMPPVTREVVDNLVEILRPELWPDRFAILYFLLYGKLDGAITNTDPASVVDEWRGLVTAVLEHLSPDTSTVECLALMSISFNGTWRTQAVDQMKCNPNVFQQLCSTYSNWESIVLLAAQGPSFSGEPRYH